MMALWLRSRPCCFAALCAVWPCRDPVPGRCLCLGGATAHGCGMWDMGCGMQSGCCLQRAWLLNFFHPTWAVRLFCLLTELTIPLSSCKKSCDICRGTNKMTDGWGTITVLSFCAHDSYSATKILILCYTRGNLISLSLCSLNPVWLKLSIRGSYRATY